MFDKEICKSLTGLKVVWYPIEKLCLVLRKKSKRTYNEIPKKYRCLFDEKYINIKKESAQRAVWLFKEKEVQKMKVELKIREVLDKSASAEKKAREICGFMDWDKDKLEAAILKHGTSESKQRGFIIDEFWAKDVLDNESNERKRLR